MPPKAAKFLTAPRPGKGREGRSCHGAEHSFPGMGTDRGHHTSRQAKQDVRREKTRAQEGKAAS